MSVISSGRVDSSEIKTDLVSYNQTASFVIIFNNTIYLLALAAWEWRRIVLDEPSQSYSKHRTVAC